jgi:hypothetical protein
MSKSTDDYEQAIEGYRTQLRTEAELADGDLDEIEDHLRSLTDELRERGMPTAEAVTEAARRLGDPRAVAREHSRVRSAFGVRLSGARMWSVVALLVPVLIYAAITMVQDIGVWTRYTLEYVVGAALVAALVMRMGWARPILLGGLAFYSIPSALFTYMFDLSPAFLVWHLAMLAFLMPWRRSELSPSGVALATYVWAYGAASWLLSFTMTTETGENVFFAPTGFIACVAAAAATTGAIMRARWSSVAGVVAAIALGVAAYELLRVQMRFEYAGLMGGALIGSAVTGVIAALVGSALAWRTARSSFGSLRAIRS